VFAAAIIANIIVAAAATGSVFGDVAAASVAALASVINTVILVHARRTQKEIKADVKRLTPHVERLEELGEEREEHIRRLTRSNRELADNTQTLQEMIPTLEAVVKRFRG
jgi:predicted RNase H-like nuclease (RuvC/YqgF family)